MGDFSLDPAAAITLGVIVGLLSTCVQSVGLTLQRKSHMLEDEKEDHDSRRPPYRRRRWQIGMFLFLVANIIGSTIQIVALPLPLLSTLQASGLVFNSILATLLLKEPWTWRSAWGTILVAAGAVLINAILQVTMFVAVLALNQRRVEANRADCFPFYRVGRADDSYLSWMQSILI